MLNIAISDFNYPLPDEKVALHPCAERSNSKLLVWNKGIISENIFSNISDYLPQNALLVFNDTRVVPARLVFHNATGARIEIFCLEPHSPKEITTAYSEKREVTFVCLIGNKKKWKNGALKILLPNDTLLTAELVGEYSNDSFLVKFSWNNNKLTFSEVLELAGKIPLPPYINRETEQEDKQRYQTIYARYNGSVAAPTAGLHFTQEMLQKLPQEKAYLTLHVGAGTFKPVKTDNISEHLMHAESLSISKEFLQQIKQALEQNRPIIPVGTTSMRTLESLYYLAVCNTNEITQWMPYTTKSNLKPFEAIDNLLKDLRNLEALSASTSLMIAPSYKFHFASGIITNFHQPKSTLLLLIAAMLGNDWKRVYNYALQNNFRFLSYGDSNLYLM
ncbi:MAG: S-adenosylmethionine:tRNA ribosyltransferase-isomerase [Bacteroidales bacterium]|jgi:S-adenosylmethionine:tRNA ribosyltransferase-isomerase|nr:S-adenosylmethionine:tRNA ribosyltransferase-isomerase [Bacteroidales bacterium]